MINWNFFDKIYCVHYLDYKERYKNICHELKRVGILDSPNFEFYYTVPNNIYNWIFLSDKNFKHNINYAYKKILDPKINTDCPECTNSDIDFRFINNTNINLLVNMLNLLLNIQKKKYKRILFLEDDIFFLKKISVIEKYIDNIQKDYDIINFDPFIYDMTQYDPITINEYYLDVSKSTLYNASMVYLNNIAIDYVLQKQNEMTLPWDNYIAYKGNKDDNLKRCIPTVNLCVQRDYDNRQEYYHENTRESKYRYMNNINMKDYNGLE